LLSKSEWITLSNQHDIFINTTNFDNLPVSVIEAMALGMPIISTDVGGLSYLIEHSENGLLVPPENLDAFVNTIHKLIKEPETVVGLSKKARAYSRQFDWMQVKGLWMMALE
jgi:glycosyltransferase involved in cell wall biosynthesis